MSPHLEAHVLNLHFVNQEYILITFFLLSALLETEDSAEVVCGPFARNRVILEDEVHLGIADIYFVEVWAAVPEQFVQGEFCDDVLGAEECIHLNVSDGVAHGVLVHDEDIFQDKCCEWFEVNLFKTDLALNLVGNVIDHFVCNCCLHLWQLYRE